MGYTTDFEGNFFLDRKLDDETRLFLVKLNSTRRIARDVDPKYGVEGEFYVNGDDLNVIDHNRPPLTQPSLWCQWVPTKAGEHIKWDGVEKFYGYIPWIVYIIDKILRPKAYELGGQIKWQGEDGDDKGLIKVVHNHVQIVSDITEDRYTGRPFLGAVTEIRSTALVSPTIMAAPRRKIVWQ